MLAAHAASGSDASAAGVDDGATEVLDPAAAGSIGAPNSPPTSATKLPTRGLQAAGGIGSANLSRLPLGLSFDITGYSFPPCSAGDCGAGLMVFTLELVLVAGATPGDEPAGADVGAAERSGRAAAGRMGAFSLSGTHAGRTAAGEMGAPFSTTALIGGPLMTFCSDIADSFIS